jgi:predicted dehydrogenase
MQMKDRVALMGAGRWGRNILRALSGLVEVPYIVHGGRTETRAFLEEHYPSAAIIDDCAVALGDTTIDAVCIATPISRHAALTRAALQAGKHVFVEKPLSLGEAEINELYALAKTKGRTLFVGYIYCYDPAFRALKAACTDARDLSVESVWQKYGTFDSPLTENLLVHEIALATELLGKGSLHTTVQSEHVYEGTYRGLRGTMSIRIDRMSNEKQKVIRVASGETMYTLSGGTLERTEKGSTIPLHPFDGVELLVRELSDFLVTTKRGAEGNAEREAIDLSVARALADLS